MKNEMFCVTKRCRETRNEIILSVHIFQKLFYLTSSVNRLLFWLKKKKKKIGVPLRLGNFFSERSLSLNSNNISVRKGSEEILVKMYL